MAWDRAGGAEEVARAGAARCHTGIIDSATTTLGLIAGVTDALGCGGRTETGMAVAAGATGRREPIWGLTIPFSASGFILVGWRGVCIVRRLNLDASISCKFNYTVMMLMSKPPGRFML